MSNYPTSPVPTELQLEEVMDVITSDLMSGGKIRRRGRNAPSWRVEMSYEFRDTTADTIEAFFRSMYGPLNAFTWTEWAMPEGFLTRSSIFVGMGDGSTVIFDLPCKSSSARTVYKDGTSTAAYTYSAGAGGLDGRDRITFTTAPALDVRITCDFTGLLSFRAIFESLSIPRRITSNSHGWHYLCSRERGRMSKTRGQDVPPKSPTPRRPQGRVSTALTPPTPQIPLRGYEGRTSPSGAPVRNTISTSAEGAPLPSFYGVCKGVTGRMICYEYIGGVIQALYIGYALGVGPVSSVTNIKLDGKLASGLTGVATYSYTRHDRLRRSTHFSTASSPGGTLGIPAWCTCWSCTASATWSAVLASQR